MTGHGQSFVLQFDYSEKESTPDDVDSLLASVHSVFQCTQLLRKFNVQDPENTLKTIETMKERLQFHLKRQQTSHRSATEVQPHIHTLYL